MVIVEELSKTYEDPDGQLIRAADGVSFSCKAGEIFGLLGPNGAGKTTTMRCLATILTPTGGTASVAGHDLICEPEEVRRNIGFLSGTTGNYARLTPRESLRFFGGLYGLRGKMLNARVETVLKLFDISSYADRANDRLSTGMKQRVGLARAVVHDPPVLILDEPTSGLDPLVSDVVEQAVKELAAAGKCVLFSTHMLSQAELICDRVAILGGGKLLAQGTVGELCGISGTKNLHDAFFSLIRGVTLAA